jgi:hypothetical protein
MSKTTKEQQEMFDRGWDAALTALTTLLEADRRSAHENKVRCSTSDDEGTYALTWIYQAEEGVYRRVIEVFAQMRTKPTPK